MQFDNGLAAPKKDLFLQARDMLLATDGVEETRKEKITTCSFNASGLCHLRTMPNSIDIGFLKGALMEDKYGLLHGETKRMQVLSLEKTSKKEIQYYLEQPWLLIS